MRVGVWNFRTHGIPLRERRKLLAAKRAASLAELGELVRSTVERSPGSTVQDRITAAAKLLGLPRARVEDWWYREVRRVEYVEGETIRINALRARESELRRLERRIEAVRIELAQMAPLDGIRPAAVPRLNRRPGRRQGRSAPA